MFRVLLCLSVVASEARVEISSRAAAPRARRGRCDGIRYHVVVHLTTLYPSFRYHVVEESAAMYSKRGAPWERSALIGLIYGCAPPAVDAFFTYSGFFCARSCARIASDPTLDARGRLRSYGARIVTRWWKFAKIHAVLIVVAFLLGDGRYFPDGGVDGWRVLATFGWKNYHRGWYGWFDTAGARRGNQNRPQRRRYGSSLNQNGPTRPADRPRTNVVGLGPPLVQLRRPARHVPDRARLCSLRRPRRDGLARGRGRGGRVPLGDYPRRPALPRRVLSRPHRAVDALDATGRRRIAGAMARRAALLARTAGPLRRLSPRRRAAPRGSQFENGERRRLLGSRRRRGHGSRRRRGGYADRPNAPRPRGSTTGRRPSTRRRTRASRPSSSAPRSRRRWRPCRRRQPGAIAARGRRAARLATAWATSGGRGDSIRPTRGKFSVGYSSWVWRSSGRPRATRSRRRCCAGARSRRWDR